MKITTYTKITYNGHVGIKTDVFICDKLPQLWQEMTANERYDYLNDMGYWDEGTDESYFGKDGSQTENVVEIEIYEEFPEPAEPEPQPEPKRSPVLQTCAHCLCTVVLTVSDHSNPDKKLCWDCYWETPAPFAAAGAAQAVAIPTPEANAAAPLGSASSVCTGGEWAGYVVVCDKDYDRWVEGIFPDEDSAQKFADAYMSEEQHNGEAYAFTVSMMTANREEWSR